MDIMLKLFSSKLPRLDMYRKSQIVLVITLSLLNLSASLQPYEEHGGSSECALLLEGPGRTSNYDYQLNTIRGNPNYGGPHTCITYDAVNNAYIQARKYIRVVERREHYMHEELATVGELVLEVSRILARTYGLSVDEIEHGLPLIDTSKTLVREICPAFLSNVHCQPGKYRRYDGLCNNLKHPTWGAVQSSFARLLKPVYSDAISDPRIGLHGSTLPPARIVSRTIHPDEGYHDHAATILLISWGQFMDHDLTLTATPLDPVTRNEPEECCHRPAGSVKNPYCNEIPIPHDDPFYGVYGVRCMDFVRGFPGTRAGCRLGSRNQFNILTAVIDGNTVYGVDENFARSLRSGYGGLLRMNPVFAQYGLHDLLPLKLDIPDEGCTRPNRSMYCFDAGEIRVNEQLVLTCMHTLMAREHNRVAHKLGEVNPHWDDETVYQESRRVVIAEIQHITYNEFLPLVLGKEVMAKFGLLLQKEGYWDGYDPNVNPGVLASFSAAAFRFGHSLLPTNVERWSKAHKFIASRRLRDLIRQPFDLYRAGVIDEYFMGMANQVAQAMDDSVTQEVTNHLFRKPGQPFGVDLAAFNMQRGREFGLPSYMEYRKYCGLPGAEGWDDLFGSMNNITVKRYAQIYVHPQDIDLWSGGVSERPLPGGMVGPTFACIIASQFSNARRGDRFWYELGNYPHSFTLEQLAELKKARLARIVCDNTDIIDTIQLYPMVLPDHEINPRVPCRSGVLLNIDFSKWADYGHSGQFSNPAPVHIDSLNLGGYENDPSVGKYVNQDGIQQLRHYLKVGPYRDYLSSKPGSHSNPFFGYLRQVITRRPVHVIDSVQGQDVSNIANVHYSPSPVHEPFHQEPVLDEGPRGFPVNPPYFQPKEPHSAKPYFGPQKQPVGGKYRESLHHMPNYNLPPYAPPKHSNGLQREYGTPNPPFITYGFQPVSSPYGNLTHGPNSYKRRYATEIPNHVIDALSELYARNNYKREIPSLKTSKRRRKIREAMSMTHEIDDVSSNEVVPVPSPPTVQNVTTFTESSNTSNSKTNSTTNSTPTASTIPTKNNNVPFFPLPISLNMTSKLSSFMSGGGGGMSAAKEVAVDIAHGIRKAVVESGFELMHGLIDLSSGLLARVQSTMTHLQERNGEISEKKLNSSNANDEKKMSNDKKRVRFNLTESAGRVVEKASGLVRTMLNDLSRTYNRRLQPERT